jgi:hypothetical protein
MPWAASAAAACLPVPSADGGFLLLPASVVSQAGHKSLASPLYPKRRTSFPWLSKRSPGAEVEPNFLFTDERPSPGTAGRCPPPVALPALYQLPCPADRLPLPVPVPLPSCSGQLSSVVQDRHDEQQCCWPTASAQDNNCLLPTAATLRYRTTTTATSKCHWKTR